MNLTLRGHQDLYAVEQLMMGLFGAQAQGEVVSSLYRGGVYLTAVTTVEVDGKKTRAVRRIQTRKESVRLRRQMLQQCLYHAALPHLSQIPPWGALAGVRPTKLTTRHLLEGGTEESADALLKEIYYVTPQRRELALQCSRCSVEAVQKLDKKDVSLYVGIPFCPTRCSYCSFVSRSIGRQTQLMEPYLQALEQELALTGRLMAQSGFTVRTLYIGGGTPTTLSSRQMERLLGIIGDSFDLRRCLEFTVEGGRPDTLDEEKLRTIRRGGANRMSINPQSMCDRVLRACARPHDAQGVLRSYRQAVDAGFDCVNMDLIAGLPEDDLEGFRYSLDTVAALNPGNITVHTLALKKGADLFEKRANLPPVQQVQQMIAYTNETLPGLGYRPYYLYRQKYMSGSFENVGWSRDKAQCLYNIYMMEELHTIVSLGGGGMNKVNAPDGSLQRFHNPKFPEQYITQLDSVLEQKRELFDRMKGSI